MRTTDRSGAHAHMLVYVSHSSLPSPRAGLTLTLTLGIVLALSLMAPSAHGFIQTRTSSGTPVTWGRGTSMNFRANTTNSSGLSANLLLDIFTTSLNRWKTAADHGFNFVYFQGTSTGTYPNYTGSTVDNSIFFTSNAANSGDRLGCGTIAVTQVWFYSGSGVAFKADLRFNDQCFRFTNSPADTASQRNIYLPDVATHELGHALGLDHSQNLQSSMVYTAWVQQAYPSCDDHAAMKAVYSASGNTGSLSGRVLTPTGSPLFGAIVEAVSLERGKAVANAITSTDGTFTVHGLEGGNYTVVVSPFYPGAASLSTYFSSITNSVCSGGAIYSRTVALASDGQARVSTVVPGGTTGFGDVTASCAPVSTPFGGSERNMATAPRLVQNGQIPAATASSFSAGSTHYYRLSGMTGSFLVYAASHSLFSRADVTVELLNTSGTRFAASQTFENVFLSAQGSGYTNYDSQASLALGSTPTDVIVRVTQRSSLSNSAFPSGSNGIDASPFYVLTVSRGVSSGNALYELNARCEAQDTFSDYAQAGDPGAMPGAPAPAPTKSTGGCGMITHVGDDGPFNGPGAAMRFGNLLLLSLMLTMARRMVGKDYLRI